jgi:hypothetical protein
MRNGATPARDWGAQFLSSPCRWAAAGRGIPNCVNPWAWHSMPLGSSWAKFFFASVVLFEKAHGNPNCVNPSVAFAPSSDFTNGAGGKGTSFLVNSLNLHLSGSQPDPVRAKLPRNGEGSALRIYPRAKKKGKKNRQKKMYVRTLFGLDFLLDIQFRVFFLNRVFEVPSSREKRPKTQ